MTRQFITAFTFASLLLAGCTSLLGGDSSNKLGGPSATSVPVGNNLTMPPDLQLPAPGSGADYQVPATPVKTAALAKPSATSIYGGGTAAPAQQDVFEQNGISKTKPDGTPKTQAELAEELKLAILRKKRQQNPGYGTIANIGNIFNDQ